jgi:hypothetical protein
MAATTAPVNTGQGIGPNNPAPASLADSAMAAQGTPPTPKAVPFTRGSRDSTMADYQGTLDFGVQKDIDLTTNAFMSALNLEFTVTTSGNSATVAFNAQQGVFALIQSLSLYDPSGTQIIAPVNGYYLYLLNKYLLDSFCNFDAKLDPNYQAVSGSGATGGSLKFQLVVPIEIRHRDAFGAVNNSASDEQYKLTIIPNSVANLYATAPTTAPTSISLKITNLYWTSPPASIQTATGAVPVQQTPTGLGTVGLINFESHNAVSGGTSAPVKLNNVGNYISNVIMILKDSSGNRDDADWPSPFGFALNDFPYQWLLQSFWTKWMAEFYGLDTTATKDSAGALDTGVYVLPGLSGLFQQADNFSPASQYLATNATTKLQIVNANFGSGAGKLDVLTRSIKPSSGAALFA